MQSHCSEDVSAELPQEGASVKFGKVLVQGRCRSLSWLFSRRPSTALRSTPDPGVPVGAYGWRWRVCLIGDFVPRKGRLAVKDRALFGPTRDELAMTKMAH